MPKRSAPTVCVLQSKPWFTFSFVGEALAKGGLQAAGAIIVYILLIFWVVNKSDTLRRAIAAKLNPVVRDSVTRPAAPRGP